MNRCGSFPLLSAPHSLFSIWTNLKRPENIAGAPTRRWVEWILLTGPSGLHRNSPHELNISSIRVFDQIRDPEIPIILRPHSYCIPHKEVTSENIMFTWGFHFINCGFRIRFNIRFFNNHSSHFLKLKIRFIVFKLFTLRTINQADLKSGQTPVGVAKLRTRTLESIIRSSLHECVVSTQ